MYLILALYGIYTITLVLARNVVVCARGWNINTNTSESVIMIRAD
jgi:hypothetical protein